MIKEDLTIELKRIIDLGWHVLPFVIEDGFDAKGNPKWFKHPATAHGVKDASNDWATVERWIDAGYDVWAISTGMSDVVVLDFDLPKDGSDYDLKAELAKLTAELGELPATVAATTCSGGKHFYFKAPALAEGAATCNLIPLMDIRCGDTAIVIPPSERPDGATYQWLPGRSPAEIGVAELSEKWVAFVKAKQGVKKVKPAEKELDDTTKNHVFNAVRDCLDAGFHVVPAEIRNTAPAGAPPKWLKKPAIAKWQEAASNDDIELVKWLKAGYGTFACHLGASNLLVIDVDQHSEDADGIATLARLEAEFGPLPKTVTTETISGGKHIYFKMPDDARVTNTNHLWPGVDLKCGIATTHLPPAKTPDGSAEYRWIVSPAEIAVAELSQGWFNGIIAELDRRQAAKNDSGLPDNWVVGAVDGIEYDDSDDNIAAAKAYIDKLPSPCQGATADTKAGTALPGGTWGLVVARTALHGFLLPPCKAEELVYNWYKSRKASDGVAPYPESDDSIHKTAKHKIEEAAKQPRCPAGQMWGWLRANNSAICGKSLTIESMTEVLIREGLPMPRINVLTQRYDLNPDYPLRQDPYYIYLKSLLINKYEYRAATKTTPAWGIKEPSKTEIADVIESIADKHEYNPLLDFLNAGVWDGVDRLPELYDILGLTNESYKTMLRCWLGECVAAVENDGTESLDGVLVIQGAQGYGKTTFFRSLAIDAGWFGSGCPDFNKQTDIQKVTSCWIYELGEFEATTRKADREVVKNFITNAKDTIRIIYTRHPVDYPRHTVCCATCNSDDFLADETGNRRFWVIKLEKKVEYEAYENFDFAQLWYQLWQEYKPLSLKERMKKWRLPKEVAAVSEEANKQYLRKLKGQLEIEDYFAKKAKQGNDDLIEVTLTDLKNQAKDVVNDSNPLERFSNVELAKALKAINPDYVSKQTRIGSSSVKLFTLPIGNREIVYPAGCVEEWQKYEYRKSLSIR